MHRVPSQANQLTTNSHLDMLLDQPAKSRSSTRSFPTNNAHQVAHNSPKETTPHTHRHRGEAPPINQSTSQPTPDNPCGSVRRKQRVPPQATLYTVANRDRPPGHFAESSAASVPCTRPQIFNQRPDSQPSTLQSTKCTHREASHSVAIPIEYPQEKALLLLLLLLLPPLNKCPPHPLAIYQSHSPRD